MTPYLGVPVACFLVCLSSFWFILLRFITRYQTKVFEKAKPAYSRNEDLDHVAVWKKDLGAMLPKMLFYAGYTRQASDLQGQFFEETLQPLLGPHPKSAKKAEWKSFMNDDNTPIEYSWSWKCSSQLPTVRYVIEAIGDNAGTLKDPYNIEETKALVERLKTQNSSIDTVWFEHFCRTLLPITTKSDTTVASHPSQLFVGFDLQGKETALKAYIFPVTRACQLNRDPFSVIEKSISGLPRCDPNLLRSFETVQRYVYGLDPGKRPRAEFLAIDCINTSTARIKIYLRFPQTSFASMLDTITLGGQLRKPSESAIKSLRMLWSCVLGLDLVIDDQEPLSQNDHRTSGLIYHFDIRNGSSVPACKLYIPVKHYSKDDEQIAVGFSRFLEYQGMRFEGTSYLNAVKSLCSHRSLKAGLGFHTYISAAVSGDKIATSSYIQPEIYHASRGRGN